MTIRKSYKQNSDLFALNKTEYIYIQYLLLKLAEVKLAEKSTILNATSEYRVCILVSLLNDDNFSTEYFI